VFACNKAKMSVIFPCIHPSLCLFPVWSHSKNLPKSGITHESRRSRSRSERSQMLESWFSWSSQHPPGMGHDLRNSENNYCFDERPTLQSSGRNFARLVRHRHRPIIECIQIGGQWRTSLWDTALTPNTPNTRGAQFFPPCSVFRSVESTGY
jgi:hypothetical protein